MRAPSPARHEPRLARTAAAALARDGFPTRGGGPRRIAARAAFSRTVWDANGTRRLPTGPALDRALAALHPADLDWICEFGPLGPVYLLPTTTWLRALAHKLEALGVRRVLEIGAGDGLLSRGLRAVAPRLEVTATDSGAWSKASARMSEAERTELRGVDVAGLSLEPDVIKLEARAAIGKFKPDLVLASWLPPAFDLGRVLRTDVRFLLEIGAAGGITPGAWNWRYAHELCEGPVETLARCRLDARPSKALQTRVTLYFGRAHPDHHCERVREGDWLWQFKPGVT